MNDRGSTSILLTLIFTGFLLLISTLITVTTFVSSKSYADSTLRLSGRSVLSEFDIHLYEDYGLFAFKAKENEVEDKLAHYINYSFINNSPKSSIKLMRIKLQGIDVNLKEFSLININLFEDQVVEAVKYGFIKDLVKEGFKDRGEEFESGEIEEGKRDRVLRNGRVIENLPSKGYDSKSNFDPKKFFGALSSIKNLEGVGNTAALTKYIFANFKHANKSKKDNKTFFENEVEYIISGKLDDMENYKSVKLKIKIFRVLQNSMHILSNPEKMRRIEAIIAALPPAGNLVAAAAIVTLWSEREAQNDIELLEKGNKVPFIKTDSSWAIDDIESLFKGTFSDQTVYPSIDKGNSYEDYLKLFILLMNREEKILKMMDLIQINMKGNYNSEFLLKEHYAGFRYKADIGSCTYSYVQKY